MNPDVLLAVAQMAGHLWTDRPVVTMTGDEFRQCHGEHPVEGYRLADGRAAVACLTCHEVFVQ
ncbi:MAG: hypothetical protein HY323_09080 [Betaproteobacteria bacterium]|nr:hypothetical protein [Betaproteobacteria bacterium]